MEDSEGGLSFDFEGGLDAAIVAAPSNPAASSGGVLIQTDASAGANAGAFNSSGGQMTGGASDGFGGGNRGGGGGGGGRSFRQTVCRHWLRSLCMKGEACGFLHQYDKSRMPVCRFFRLYGECREQDCVYKHTNEDIKECNMYKLGFCPNGPDCRYRHAKLPGPPPSVEEVFQKIQHLSSYNNYNSNKFFQHRNTGFGQQADKSQGFQGPNSGVNQGATGKPLMAESANPQNQQVQQSQIPVGQNQMPNGPNGLPNQANRNVSPSPLPQGISRYFIVKSCNRENLELSVQQGVWATQRSNEAKLNEAFDSVDNVILIFSVNRTRHFQGCAKMTSRIGASVSGGNWKYAHGTAHYGRNFSVKWLKLCELSFHKSRHLRNPYNENLPVKISRDCQELEASIGEQLASLLHEEPDSELMAISVAAETKREEEKAKGVNPDDGGENPDIVPFEDNEEEEEEESDDEEEGFAHFPGGPNPGRGRGRGVPWGPHMPMPRGARPMPGFPPVMMGPDGFTPDGFPIPDLFNVGPRGFNPYNPRFPGDFMGMNMMFRGRPPQPGGVFPGMMMAPGRGPFMGRPARPMFPPPPPPLNRGPRRGPVNERNDDEARYQQGPRAHPEDQQRGGESESEDEAPRRSRHGEGKKKRRSSEGESNAGSDH